MIKRLVGAVVRAMMVVLLIATPALLLPGVSADGQQIVTLVAIFGAALTIFEYASAYPGLVEFRDAPPFNRIRFVSLFATVVLLTIITRGQVDPTPTTQLFEAIGTLIGVAIDFPYSPVRLIVLMLPEGTDVQHLILVRTAAGLAYLISLVTLAVFMITLRLNAWPSPTGTFNVWVNLPTFDPTTGGDVVARLERDSRYNIALGFLLPFVTPAVVKATSSIFGSVTLEEPQTMIWTVAAWAFLPASLFMRGIAMGRIATMISDKRNGASGENDSHQMQPV